MIKTEISHSFMHKKIMIISNVPFLGGAENFIIKELQLLESYYTVYYLVNCKDILNGIRNKSNVLLFQNSKRIAQCFEIRKIVRSIKPDLVIFNGGSSSYILPLLRGTKTIFYKHSTCLCASKYLRFRYALLLNFISFFADLTIHASRYSMNEQWIAKKRCVCIHNAIEVDEYAQEFPRKKIQAPLRVLYCGRLEESKGIELAIQAFEKIPPQVAELHIVGTGSLEKKLRRYAKSNIIFYGFQSNPDFFLRHADALILLSKAENCPLSILEAMNRELPVIATRCGGIAELVQDGETGIFVSESINDIMNAVDKLAENREYCRLLGKNAKKRCMKDFNLQKQILIIRQHIDHILNS